MEGLVDILKWVTGSIEGIAFVEYLILIAIGFLYRKINILMTELSELKYKVDEHERDCIKQFAEGSKTMALLNERYANLHEDVREALKK